MASAPSKVEIAFSRDSRGKLEKLTKAVESLSKAHAELLAEFKKTAEIIKAFNVAADKKEEED